VSPRFGAPITATPPVPAHNGNEMSADDAAWMLIADAALVASTLPGLSACGVARMRRLRAASLRAGGQEVDGHP
jgi:hypothetical protein